MKLKKLVTSTLLMLTTITMSAQIMLSPVFESAINGLNENNVSIAEGRIQSVISSMDMESGYGGRFILACKVSALQREVSGTKLIQHLQVQFAVGDNLSNVCFGSVMTEALGIGNTEEQAMTDALRNIKNFSQLKNLVATSKERIVDYYNKNGATIVQKAKTLISAQKWEEALYELSAIPEECVYYNDALDMMNKLYVQYINHDAMQVLNEAQALWSADPNPGPTAQRAMEILATINTSAKCYPQAQALMNKISNRVQNVTDQERRNEQEMERARLNAVKAVAKARIKACRDVAVAYARRKVVVRNYYRSWW